MLNFEQWEFIPEKEQNRIIDIIFGANIDSEIERIKTDIKTNGEDSEFIDTLLENISYKYGNQNIGYYYEVSGLVYVKPIISPENDHE